MTHRRNNSGCYYPEEPCICISTEELQERLGANHVISPGPQEDGTYIMTAEGVHGHGYAQFIYYKDSDTIGKRFCRTDGFKTQYEELAANQIAVYESSVSWRNWIYYQKNKGS